MFDQQELNALYRYAFVLCQHEADAYDLLQGAIEKYLVAVKCQRDIQQPMGYVRTLMRNRFIDGYRHARYWPHQPYEEMAAYDISLTNIEQLHIQQSELDAIWQRLEPVDRDILYHWAVLGMSTDEACAVLGMKRGTLLSRIHRLRSKLVRGTGGDADGDLERGIDEKGKA